MHLLQDRVAVVTGAGRGLGREHALLLAAHGAAVVVNDLADTDGSPSQEVAEEIVARGGQAIADGSDVSTWSGGEEVIAAAVAAFGRVDIVVNNAGILRDATIAGMSEAAWDDVVRVNLKGHFTVAHFAAQHWRERSKRGEEVRASLINTSSESGVFGNRGQANYAAAKAGVAALTEVAHKELGRYGARSNAILPRARTRLTENLLEEPREGAFDAWDAANVSPFVAYLASETCPISGEVFMVGGSVVQRARPWSLDPGWKLTTEGRWTVEALAAAVAERGVPHDPERDTGNVR